MILELDLGNSRAKWRIANNRAGVVAQGAALVADWLDGQFPDVWYRGVERARVASVLSSATEAELFAKIRSAIPMAFQAAKSSAACCGVINAYANPEHLGVDRWLAMIAAYKKCGEAVMVVDAGTALKIDAVDDEGHHAGGYVVPGAVLMERALLAGTDRVRYESGLQMEGMMLGRDTRSCVQHGIAAALAGTVLVAIAQCRSMLGRQPRLLITGGLGVLLEARLREVGISNGELDADLVLDGLSLALP